MIDEVDRRHPGLRAVDELRDAVAAWCRDEGLTAYDRRDHGGFLRNLVVREGRRTGQLQARLSRARARSTATRSRPRCAGRQRAVDPGRRRRPRPRATARRSCSRAGAHGIEELTLGGTTLRFGISPEAFFQTNTEMAERLYAIAAEPAGLTGRERVFDLYCGIGTIALALALEAARGGGRRDRRATPSPTRSRTPSATAWTTPASSPATCAPRCAR